MVTILCCSPPRCPIPRFYLSPGSDIELLLRVDVFSNYRQSMLPCTLALLPLQLLDYQFRNWGNFTPSSRMGTLYAFQPRIRAMGLPPTSETKLSFGDLFQPLPEAICPPTFVGLR